MGFIAKHCFHGKSLFQSEAEALISCLIAGAIALNLIYAKTEIMGNGRIINNDRYQNKEGLKEKVSSLLENNQRAKRAYVK